MKKLIFFMAIFALNFVGFAQEAEVETEDASTEGEAVVEESADSAEELVVFGEIGDVFELFVEDDNGLKYSGFENEIEALLGLEYRVADFMVIGGFLESYTDLLTLDTPDFNQVKLEEQEFAAGFFFVVDGFEPVQFKMSTNMVFNLRPEDLFRFGPGVVLELYGEIEDAHIEYSVGNSMNFLSGLGTTQRNFLLANTLSWGVRFDFLNFVKEDLGLGLLLEGEFESEDLFVGGARDSFVYENEFFAGFVYSPVDAVELNLCFAMYNVNEDSDIGLELGMRTGIAYAGEIFSMGLNYIPKIKTFSNGVDTGSNHSLEFTIGFGF
ncbi:MAG: hypothetical protein JXR63_06575 [Spirochaetales bacterium]|nr:hypothetical protein [Spirochaetales bacterium]